MLRSRRSTRLFRPILFERLERRRLFAVTQNPLNHYDVDDSGIVSALDALMVINAITIEDFGIATGTKEPVLSEGPFYDVNADEKVSAADALDVIYALNRGQGTLNLSLSVAPDSDPNGNGVVLSPAIEIRGQVSKEASLQLSVTALDQELNEVSGKQATSNVTVGQASEFSFSPSLFFGRNLIELTATDILGNRLSVSQEIVLGDHVADWNAAALNVVRDWTTTSDDPYEGRIVPSSPPIVAKNLAMIHVAMFDALNSFTNEFTPYLAVESPPIDASPIAASASAAFEVAKAIYPAPRELAVWQATLAESFAQVTDASARDKGIAFGKLIASSVLSARENDGSSQSSNYAPGGSSPGEWNRTGPDYLPPLLPFWGSVKPFAVENVIDFRPVAPPALDSAEYAAAVDEVLGVGRTDSTERTADQTDIAVFWADGGGTASPPGHWNRIATDLSLASGQSTLERARTLALLNLGLADAGIAAWDAKYAFDFWRPIDAIRQADDDGNAATVADATWQPLLRTPPFPTYTSGHSTFSGAGASVLTSIFGDNVSFATRSDGHTGLTQRPLTTISTRHFNSLWEAAEEAGVSRIYGGIHFAFDNTAGLSSGAAVGHDVANNWLKPVN